MYGGWHYAAVYGYSDKYVFVMNPSLNPGQYGQHLVCSQEDQIQTDMEQMDAGSRAAPVEVAGAFRR
jgi:hypothetical protein